MSRLRSLRAGGAQARTPVGPAPRTRVTALHPLMHLQRSAGNAALAGWRADLAARLGPGREIEPAARRVQEENLGTDLGPVRVHNDRPAGASARALNARAFTIGQEIVFGAGEYRPDTPGGRRLLGHELAHVVQQSRAGKPAIQRQPLPATPEWQGHLDAILPKDVGLVADIDRVITLLDTLGEAELARVVGLIHGSKDATALVKHHGVPGIVAIADTLTGSRLNLPLDQFDLPAAEFLLIQFPSRIHPAPKRDPSTPAEVFSVEAVRQAYVQFHRNAFLDKEDEQRKPVRKNCIVIIRDLVPQLFAADPRLAKRITQALGKLKGATLTMPDAGAELSRLGVGGKPIDIRFKDGNGLKMEPTTMQSSAFDAILAQVGGVQGWHVFGMSVMSGYHSVTIFVDNDPKDPRLYWSDQWKIDREGQFGQAPNAISGFRRYEAAAAFDGFIEQITNRWWHEVNTSGSKCAARARAKGHRWETFCRYPGTLRIWHFRTVPKK